MSGLHYVSWADNSGYAIAAFGYLRLLRDAGIDLTWTPMLPSAQGYAEVPSVAGEFSPLCGQNIDHDTVLVHTPPEYFPAWASKARQDGRRILGYTVWELDALPPHWPALINQLDGVLVPTAVNAQAFQRSGVTTPIHVVPHHSQFEHAADPTDDDRSRLRQRIAPHLLEPSPFVFYAIGQWSLRKGLDAALAAYRAAFTAADPVLLVIKTSARDVTQLERDWRTGFRRRHPSPLRTIARGQGAASPKVAAIADETLSPGEVLALHELGDCYISLARAEGWGLSTFDAARLGRPVVATGWGGHATYLDAESVPPGPVAFDMVPLSEAPWLGSYTGDQLWAEPSIADAADKLRRVFANRQCATDGALVRAERLRKDYSAEAITGQLLGALA